MGENSKIEWTDDTFNPWRGCAKVSPGCANCYAEKQSLRNPRVLGVWGVDGERPFASEAYWRQPVKWNREAQAKGERRKVFCSSMADIFEDREELDGARIRLFGLVLELTWLDFQMLTKRAHLILPTLERLADWKATTELERATVTMIRAWLEGRPPDNVWLGVSAEDQQRWNERVPFLVAVSAVVHFVSVEPMLGPVDIGRLGCELPDWVIVGGESGPKSRTFEIPWAISVVDRAHSLDVACFVKQYGEKPSWGGEEFVVTKDKKGQDMSEWPPRLRVREFPTPRRST